jgi:hypothetical protein
LRILPAAWCFAAATANFVLCSPSTAAERSPRSGIFSNVEESPNSGDLHGTEIEIHADGPRPYALVVLCNDWCHDSHRVPLKVHDDRFEFSFTAHTVASSGGLIDTNRYRVVGQMLGASLKIRVIGYAAPDTEVLKRRKRRFGLAVAHPVAEQQ